MSELALQLIREAKEKRLTRLDLGKCGLTKLPEELFELVWLEELILSDEWEEYSFNEKEEVLYCSQNWGYSNRLSYIHSNISELKCLKKLVASGDYNLADLTPLESLTQLQQLYVSNTEISDLSPLKGLTKLQVLHISKTKVSDLTPLRGLTELQVLYTSHSKVNDLTPLNNKLKLQVFYAAATQVSDLAPLKELYKLQELYVSAQVSDLTPLKELTQLQGLYVPESLVSDLTPLKELTQLQKLYIFDTQVSDLSPLKGLLQLQTLYVSETQVSDLTPLKDLAQLQTLYVSDTQVSDLSPLKDLAQLQTLYVSDTQVSDLSPLKDLAQLQALDVSNTQVSDLSPLKDLAQLQALDVYNTKVSDLSPLKDLAQLQDLYVFNTKVDHLSPLKDLTRLEVLSVHHTQVSDLSPLSDLTQLKEIFVDNTQVKDLNPLKNLTQLQQLYVYNTQVSDLMPLKDLTKIQKLDIARTQVSDLTPLKDLTQLHLLDISITQVSDLSPLKKLLEKGVMIKWAKSDAIGNLGIYVKNCPFDKAQVAAIKKGNNAVLNYLNKPKKRLFEVRVLVLGEPRAGKTTLRRKLKKPTAPMPTALESTKAFEIEIDPYTCTIEKNGEKNKLTYHLWDFGGQDYYRLLHQLFVAEQSVYVIVTDTDRNKNEEEIDFWLETIQRLGKDKNGNYGPVVLFQNPKTNRDGNEFVDLKKRYPFWKQTEQFTINLNALAKNTASFDKRELERFKRFKSYLEESFCQLDHIGKEMPTQWINVRNTLKKHEKDNWINIEQFNKVCASNGITKSGDKDDLLDIFHTLGYVLHYKDTALKGMVILNREWVTDALYRVLDDKIVSGNKGWFTTQDAEKIWHEDRYKNRTTELLTLMEVFKLSYFNSVSKKHIVPAKLPEDTDGLPIWNNEQCVQLHLQYDWMPRAVATQLIVSLHNDIVVLKGGEHWIWRKGAVLDGRNLDLNGVQVKIEDNAKHNKIEITAKGDHSELLIRNVMRTWREVNSPFEDKVKVSKIILCACERCQTAAAPFEYEYDDVLEAKIAGESLKCNKSRKEFIATDILKGLFDETTQLADTMLAKGEKSEILNLIADGRTDRALDKLTTNEITVSLKNRYQRIVLENMKGILSTEEYRLEENKIANAIIGYLKRNKENDLNDAKIIRKLFDEGHFEKEIAKYSGSLLESAPTINIYGGQVNFANDIHNVVYKPNLGVSKADFESLKSTIETLSQTNLLALEEFIQSEPPPQTPAEKESIGKRLYNWINQNAEGLSVNVGASVYYDVLKTLFGIP